MADAKDLDRPSKEQMDAMVDFNGIDRSDTGRSTEISTLPTIQELNDKLNSQDEYIKHLELAVSDKKMCFEETEVKLIVLQSMIKDTIPTRLAEYDHAKEEFRTNFRTLCSFCLECLTDV